MEQASGLYVVTALIPGTYNVEIKAAGFKTEEVNDVKLVIDDVARVDAQLEVGAGSQKLTVIAEGAGLLQATESCRRQTWPAWAGGKDAGAHVVQICATL